jgi:hypothetical protein
VESSSSLFKQKSDTRELPVIRVCIESLVLCRNADRKRIKRKDEIRRNVEKRKLN